MVNEQGLQDIARELDSYCELHILAQFQTKLNLVKYCQYISSCNYELALGAYSCLCVCVCVCFLAEEGVYFLFSFVFCLCVFDSSQNPEFQI